jgi:hypothetical protein
VPGFPPIPIFKLALSSEPSDQPNITTLTYSLPSRFYGSLNYFSIATKSGKSVMLFMIFWVLMLFVLLE